MKLVRRNFFAIVRRFSTETPKTSEIVNKPVVEGENVVNASPSTEQTPIVETIIKTAEEIKAEIEAQERKIKEQQEIEQMLRKTMWRGLRATILIVLSLSAYFFVLATKGKDSKFLKWVDEVYYGVKPSQAPVDLALDPTATPSEQSEKK